MPTFWQLLWLTVVVYAGIGLFVFGLTAFGARTAREWRYAAKVALCWPWLFGKLQ